MHQIEMKTLNELIRKSSEFKSVRFAESGSIDQPKYVGVIVRMEHTYRGRTVKTDIHFTEKLEVILNKNLTPRVKAKELAESMRRYILTGNKPAFDAKMYQYVLDHSEDLYVSDIADVKFEDGNRLHKVYTITKKLADSFNQES